MKVKYNNKEYELKYSFRALMVYENITNKSLDIKGLTDIINFFYSVLLVAAKGDVIQYDDFLDWLDENPNELEKFSSWLIGILKQNSLLMPNAKSDDKKDEGDGERKN